MYIWKRYLLTRFWLSLLSLILLTFIFYASIHYALHAIKGNTHTLASGASLKLSILYYLAQISLKAEFLIPQLVAVATTMTLFSMQNKREVLVLQASGLSLKALTAPLIHSSFFITLLLYGNFQWLHPICEKISTTKEHIDRGTLDKAQDKIPALYLKDQTILLYSSIDLKTFTLNKVFWIKNPHTIYTMEKLAFTTPSLPIGLDVIRFAGTESGGMELSEFSDMKEFPEIEFGFYENPFSKIFTAGRKNRFSESFRAIPWNATGLGLSTQIPQRILSLLSLFYYMLISPLACISSMILSAYLCLRFSRIPKVSLAYIVPLSSINTFFVFLKAGIVLANSSVLPTLPVMVFPLVVLAIFTGLAYVKLQ
ncbi:LptF/LptG family permease [Chlamydia gallinacea]|uniref:Permease n=2 Tax=Chlamydia gallinacea TaxID=1457153 RepID=A0A173DY32_9CHLA|nr:LptF/LptG family permease [Chlamydia gallinacea]EYE60837.1 putative permease YjgP/YjgQ family protein [Bacteroides fragilis str. S6L5]ANG65845.1 permease [Chlamydia gallinacea 08-1274/3]AQT77099.1 permease [Chlamydia gallinacea]MBX6680401.1 LptF/LptG family permease [Chlamydia gallinacea]MBX6687477.1 LptF/LptG family permease [Chlamydia gallinacea]